jgi:hypothetical protein
VTVRALLQGLALTQEMPSRFVPATLLTACVLLVVPALARSDDPKDQREEKIKITVVAVLASSRHNTIDKRLKELAPELKKKNSDWTGFEVERQMCESIKVGGSATFKLVDDCKVVIEVKERDPKSGCVSLVVKPDTLGEIAYTCCCEKYVPVITRYDTKNKDRLIIAIMTKCGK